MSHAIEVRVEQVGPSTSKGVARSHTVLIDRPVPKGGADQGPLGGELLLLALGGCLGARSHRASPIARGGMLAP